MSTQTAIDRLLATINMHRHSFEPGTAHVEIHGNQVLNTVLVPGLHVDSVENSRGVDVEIRVDPGTVIDKPVYFCFGMLENGLQHIRMNVHFGENAKARFISHCTFSAASEVEHLMDADIHLERGSEYTYFERHIHSNEKESRLCQRQKPSLRRAVIFPPSSS
jgi:hypothetical protein